MLFNNPASFREEMLHGYAAAYPEYVQEVDGGVARATELPKNKIAVINGGGSGHYPAFCGIIGDGFMDATVVGNVFTSPSTDDVYNVGKSVENGNGLFIIGGNYAGDKMNFNLARDRFISEGIDARTFYITDDIASAPKDEWEKRRGNVGTFTVFKIAGAAAADGVSFDELVSITTEANARTRTMSVGFKGCTLPGASEPLFHVPAGKMEVGQGIHGEPGVFESDLVNAETIAQLLASRILEEKPEDAGNRIAVILDGLGSTKYEELFVVWNSVHQILSEAGYELVMPLVGEYVTSLDMAGIALSITFLNDGLEKYWTAPADTPSFKRGVTQHGSAKRLVIEREKNEQGSCTSTSYEGVSEAAQSAAGIVVSGLEKALKIISENEGMLARIDSFAGDGDHGRGMVKGLTFAFEAAQEMKGKGAGIGTVLQEAGKAWASKAGGTSGVLWGEALQAAGDRFDDALKDYDSSVALSAINSAIQRMQELGHAELGDKTMLDALIPFYNALVDKAKDLNLLDAWKEAAGVASKAAEDTSNLVPKVGRARPQAERSIGHPDAGAVSMAMCLTAAAEE